jgi:hypothetical protein
VGPRYILDTVVKRKIPSSCWESNPRTLTIQPMAVVSYLQITDAPDPSHPLQRLEKVTETLLLITDDYYFSVSL